MTWMTIPAHRRAEMVALYPVHGILRWPTNTIPADQRAEVLALLAAAHAAQCGQTDDGEN